MGKSIEIFFDELVTEIKEEIVVELSKRYDEVMESAQEQFDKGKTVVKVGYEPQWLYLGVFCDENSVTQEQIDILENLNKQILSKLNYIFAKTDKLACTYNALKKYLPKLDNNDLVQVEVLKQEIISKSTAKYLGEYTLGQELIQMYQLLKGIRQLEVQAKEQMYSKVELYDYDAVREEYRKLHLIYRCYKAVIEWQNERLEIYMGRGNKQKIELIKDEDFDLIRDKLYEFEVESKKYHTSELVNLVLNAEKTGQVDNELFEKINLIVNEKE